MLTNLWHSICYQQTQMHKDGIGTVYVCSDRLLRRVRHAYFYPELDPPLRHVLPVDRLADFLAAKSPADAVRLLAAEQR